MISCVFIYSISTRSLDFFHQFEFGCSLEHWYQSTCPNIITESFVQATDMWRCEGIVIQPTFSPGAPKAYLNDAGLPETNIATNRRPPPKGNKIFQPQCFRCYVSFRECVSLTLDSRLGWTFNITKHARKWVWGLNLIIIAFWINYPNYRLFICSFQHWSFRYIFK